MKKTKRRSASEPASSGPSRTGPAVALAATALVIVVAVLPAACGFDPLGTGRALGLLNAPTADGQATQATSPPANATPAAANPIFPQAGSYITDSRQFKLAPNEGMEFMYRLGSGATMLYDWSASAALEYDFHSELPFEPPEAAKSYEKGEASLQRGAYVANRVGLHGWFWRNHSAQPVILTLKATGFFSGAKRFYENGATEDIALGQ